VLSGVIVDNVSWRWLFIVGAVEIGAALVLVQRFIPESPIKTPSRVDYIGSSTRSAIPRDQQQDCGGGEPRVCAPTSSPTSHPPQCN